MASNLFSRFKKAPTASFSMYLETSGVTFKGAGRFSELPAVEWLGKGHEISPPDGDAILYLSQLEQDGVGPTYDDQFIIGWSDFYRILYDEGHASGVALLGLPPTCSLTPELSSKGSVSDSDFAIGLGWLDELGTRVSVTRSGGGVHRDTGWSLLPESAWKLAEGVSEFARRSDDQRVRAKQELAWGRIRSLAKVAGAKFDGYLAKTIVLSPERLSLELRSSWVGDTQVVEVVPGIEGVSQDQWLKSFDGFGRIQDHYVLPMSDGGMTRIIPTPAVSKVLSEIKRMPGRRVAGKRAQAFIRNPYATLGADIAKALPPETFENARRQAGIVLYGFNCKAARESNGKIRCVDIEFIPDLEKATVPPTQTITDKSALKLFVDAMAKALDENELCFRWKDKDLEIDGEFCYPSFPHWIVAR